MLLHLSHLVYVNHGAHVIYDPALLETAITGTMRTPTALTVAACVMVWEKRCTLSAHIVAEQTLSGVRKLSALRSLKGVGLVV
tara:strand:- start:1867 stop:2115 length:249 start_codon:yes stop_codon:yes gene_type:complete